MKRVYAVNADILHTDQMNLLNTEDEAVIEEFFQVWAKGNDEWFIVLNREVVEASDSFIAKLILKKIGEFAAWISKGCDSEKEERILNETWELTFVWG